MTKGCVCFHFGRNKHDVGRAIPVHVFCRSDCNLGTVSTTLPHPFSTCNFLRHLWHQFNLLHHHDPLGFTWFHHEVTIEQVALRKKTTNYDKGRCFFMFLFAVDRLWCIWYKYNMNNLLWLYDFAFDVYVTCVFSFFQAIDSFGNRYLLGVFENKDDAKKAFDAWNKEYEQVRIRIQGIQGDQLDHRYQKQKKRNDPSTSKSRAFLRVEVLKRKCPEEFTKGPSGVL